MRSKRQVFRRALAAAVATTAITAGATPVTQHIVTDSSWTLRYTDTVAGTLTGSAFSYDCLGSSSGPQCLSVTSTGYAAGTWLPGGGAGGFTGVWDTFIEWVVPTEATNLRLDYRIDGVDDRTQITVSSISHTYDLGVVLLTDTPVEDSVDVSSLGTGTVRLTLSVANGPGIGPTGTPSPIGGGDGTAVVGSFRFTYDLPGGGTVPEPGSLLTAATALVLMRRALRRARPR